MTPEEDEALRKAVAIVGESNWVEVSKCTGILDNQ